MARAHVGLVFLALVALGCGSSEDDAGAAQAGAGTGGSGGSGGSAGSGGPIAAGAAGGGAAPLDASDGSSGASAGSAGTGGTGAGDAAADSTEAGADGPISGCSAPAPQPGDQTVSLPFGGLTRSYLLHVPKGYKAGAPTPLVLNFHGYTMNASGEAIFSGMSPKSDNEGFVLAYPEGIATSWNGGACCGQAKSSNVDDVGFARAVVADIQARLCVDPKRVYACGMSNGGFLAHRLGCEAADLFAAIAPVAAVLGIPPASCKPSRPVPVIHFHGTNDMIVPYNGNALIDYPSAPETFKGWAARDGCTDAQPAQTLQKGAAACATYQSCSAGAKVTLCTIQGEGHCWPGQSVCPYGTSNTDISANDVMWDFLRGFALP